MKIAAQRIRLAALATVLLVSCTAHVASAGPLILAGHDPDDHGFTSQYVPLFNAIRSNVTNGGSGILAIGADPGSPAGNWINSVASLMTPPQTVTFVNNAAISTVSFSSYAMLHIPSTTVDVSGGIHATNENPLLSARAADIAAFINAGGGLFGLTQDQVADAYDYLGPFANVTAVGVPSSGACGGGQSYDNVTATPLGTSLGITDTNIDGCCWHNVFSSYAPFLSVLATANEPGCTSPVINGLPSVIGCLDCSIPSQLNLTPPVDLNPPNTNHTVTATFLQGFAPNNPIVGALVTFTVISGPNVGTTGTATTNGSGQATFTYTGTGGIGLDVIRATAVDPSTNATITSNDVRKYWDEDCNANLIPDTCDLDCSAYSNACLENYGGCGASNDLNANEVPDECDECVTSVDCSDGAFCNGSEICVAGNCQPGTPPDCDDAVACTLDACNEATDQCDHAANNGSCDDSLFCNGVETCNVVSGCQAGTPVSCSDGIACTTDTCNESTDQCVHGANNALCGNGQYCDGSEVCNPATGCEAGPAILCSDGFGCTLDTCNEATDQCDHVADHGACNDLQFCNGVEACDLVAGCVAGTPVNCSDGVACTTDACDEMVDQCTHSPNHGSCSNGQFCDGAEVCDPVGGCEAGAPIDCGDGVACTADACNEAADQCDHSPSDAACNNGQFCDGAETCDPVNDCEPGTPVLCDDGVSCTTDACNEAGDQCDHTPSDAVCSNGQFCDGAETCDPVNDCEPGTPVSCDDGVSCTSDACDEGADECDHTPNDAVCVNGQFCDGTETCDPVDDCQPGTDPCVPLSCSEVLDQCVTCLTDAQCDNGQFCDGVETCNEGTGMCVAGTPLVCDDGVSCTADACDEQADACTATPNDAVCSNGQYCDGQETCNPASGCQAGTPVECADTVACTIDACNEAQDRCTYTPDNTPCSDGQFCNGVEVCSLSQGCRPGTPRSCGDGVSCTADACDEALDVCTHAPNHAYCSDGLFCNGIEVCDLVNNCQDVAPPSCSDGVACTNDSCDELADACQHTVNHALCANGLYCDGNEVCDPSLGCGPGVPVDCSDDNACTVNSCQESADMCLATDICCGNGGIDVGEECDDGNLVDADGCDSNCLYTRCGNGIVTPGEECEYTEICSNLLDDDEDGLYDCADPDCEVENCTAACTLAPPCTCIEEDPAIVLLSKTPNFFRLHGRIPGDVSTIDPQGDGVTLQLSNADGVIYQAMLPPGSFVMKSATRFAYKDKTATTGVDPVGPHAGLAQLSMMFREIDGVDYLTFKLKAYGDFSLATLPCMTTQLTIGDDVAALRADWTLRKAGAWWLRPGDYVCPSSCDGDVP